jgi:hypothetical protein
LDEAVAAGVLDDGPGRWHGGIYATSGPAVDYSQTAKNR